MMWASSPITDGSSVSVPSVTSETRHFEHRPPALAQRILRVLSEIATRRAYSAHRKGLRQCSWAMPLGIWVFSSPSQFQQRAVSSPIERGHETPVPDLARPQVG